MPMKQSGKRRRENILLRDLEEDKEIVKLNELLAKIENYFVENQNFQLAWGWEGARVVE